MDRRAERLAVQRRVQHLERREQLAAQIQKGEQLVVEFRAELTALQSAAGEEQANIDALRRMAARADCNLQAQVQYSSSSAVHVCIAAYPLRSHRPASSNGRRRRSRPRRRRWWRRRRHWPHCSSRWGRRAHYAHGV